jgi:cytochrome c oxidase subunit 2
MTPFALLQRMSALQSDGPQAAHIEWMWWLTLAVTGVVYLLVMGFLFVAVTRRRHEDELHHSREHKRTLWVASAAVLSSVILVGLLVASVVTGRSISELSTANAIEIKLTGQQWWWEAEYQHPEPSQSFTTANEIHIPVGRPVRLKLASVDVIHSFWIPSLHGKRDMIPGEVNLLTIRADKPGVYRGQCAEYCGLQHAHMVLFVVAEPQDQFDRWYANQVKPARAPVTDEQKLGQQVFLQGSCVMCHQIRGTPAGARYGPELTHLKSRGSIAAGTLPNTRGSLGGWISNPHSVKPGVKMPANTLEPRELNALLGYLESLE